MPSNIFANTGTNVSVLFIDKTNLNGEVLLMDASKMGHKEKIKDLQKTVLTSKELNKIVNVKSYMSVSSFSSLSTFSGLNTNLEVS